MKLWRSLQRLEAARKSNCRGPDSSLSQRSCVWHCCMSCSIMLNTMNIIVYITCTHSAGTLRLAPFFYSWIPLQDTLGRLTVSPTDNNNHVLYFAFQETQNRRLITELRPTRCLRACKILSLCVEGLHLIFHPLLFVRLFLLWKNVNLQSPRRLPGTRLISTLRTQMRG